MILIPETRWTYAIEFRRIGRCWRLQAKADTTMIAFMGGRGDLTVTPPAGATFEWVKEPPTPKTVTKADYVGWKIDHTMVVEGSRLSDTEVRLAEARFIKLMDAEIERTMLAGYPRGYDTRTGMPGALHANAKPSRYGVISDIEGVT